ncbi:hypothetical protein [Sphingomonas oligophenolica]|uniref:Lipoprotein n=1 Tax=Sphingomonas oligophenolica TaxID=301154 RepID=A0A502CHK9_9SPHN|nr:hypothetical protein [Sphingomonas oligophenolica]TPG12130.1 hypothetical protein EAH84_10305 [Sphingomonas oligophenolica]
MRLPVPPLASPARLAALTALALVVGCVPQPPAPPPPARQPTAAPSPPAPMPSPALAADWRDWPMTPGTWVYRRDPRGSIALFGPANADALVTLRCDTAAKRIYLSKAGTLATPMTVRTTSIARTLQVQPTGGTPPYVATALTPRDALLDAIGFSRGRFTLEQSGATPLVLPPWAEVERVTEDCRG